MSTAKPLLSDETGVRMAKALEGLYIGKRCLVNVNNDNWGTVSGGGAFTAGSTVTLTATPSSGCGFLAWKDSNGNILGTARTYTFTILNDTIIQAIFIDDEVTEIVSWAEGDLTKIAAMIAAAYAGIIDLHDYWSVGDTRTVALSAMSNTDGTVSVEETHAAQNTEWVLMDSTLDGIKLASDGTTTPLFAVGMKDSLAEAGYMNSTSTNVGGWDQCARRGWCNAIFANALPAAFKALFKPFKWSLYGGSGASPVLTESTDTFALPPAKCVFGSASYSHGSEAALFNVWEWYQTTANRIKKRGISGSANYWWEASPYGSNASSWCYVNAGGSAGGSLAHLSYGLSPFGCI